MYIYIFFQIGVCAGHNAKKNILKKIYIYNFFSRVLHPNGIPPCHVFFNPKK